MMNFLRRLFGLPTQQTAWIRTMPREIWERQWQRVLVLAPAADGTRRFFWPGAAGFEFDEHASFIEEIRA